MLFSTSVNAQHYNFKGISVEEGLPRSGAYSLLEDTKGYLWITLDGGGVARYDGQHFKTIDLSNGLPSRKVRAIFEDSNHNLWFGTTQGLCKYNEGKVQVFTSEHGLPHSYIRAISEDKEGRLIIGTNKGVSSYDGTNFTTLKSDNDSIFSTKIRTIHTTKKNITYIGSEEGLFSIKNNKITPSELNDLLPNETVLSILDDSKGNLWIGTEQGVIAHHNDSVTLYNFEKGLISNRIRAICEDNNHNIWLGTRMGVSCITKKEIININSSNGLTHERIRDILLDNNGTLWFATFYGGINNFNPKDFVTFSTNEGLPSNQILSISETNNNKIIAGTFDGVSTFNIENGTIKNIKNFTSLNGLPHNRTFAIYKDNFNFIWLGTKKGIAITNDFQNFNLITDSISDIESEIYTIVQENDNTYWIGGEEGLFQITFSKFPSKYIVLQYNNEKIPANDISSLAIDNDKNLWIGYRHAGIRIKKNNGGGFITPKLSQNIENISSIVINNNQVWIGTDTEGLFCINNPDLENELKVKQYTKEQGLTSSNIYAIVTIDEENIWVGSEKGVDKIQLTTQLDIEHVDHFGKEDGIIGGEIIEKSILLSKSNNLLLGTVKGLVSSSAMEYNANHEPPKLHLLKFESFSKENNVKMSHINNIENVKIEYTSNNISLEFIGIDLNSPNKVKYKWYLEGYSKNWSQPTSRAFLDFTNLTDKKYKLKIKSAGVNNIWNETPLIIDFKIKTPYWKSLWFIILIILLIIASVYIGVKWKINQLIKQREALEYKIEKATQTIKEEKLLIEEQSSQIFEQKELLEEQHKEIKQSIDYAQLIQDASLPEKKITELIPDSFLYYNPRDIVSGDFYWWEEKNDYTLFCVADSTGHGIPGAFISLIGTILSNEIFHSKNLIYPNQILDELNKTIQITLEQHLPNPKIKDGMDLSFCCYNKAKKKLYFSGANNPLWLVRHNETPLNLNNNLSNPNYINIDNNTSKLYEVKGDKQPIGLHAIKQHPFTLNELDIEQGDEIYLFTDGYADQFGGEKNKKFMSKKFKHLVSSNNKRSMQEAKDIIESNFINWRGKNAQIDDVCVVGVRF